MFLTRIWYKITFPSWIGANKKENDELITYVLNIVKLQIKIVNFIV